MTKVVHSSREKATMFALRLSIIVAFVAAFIPTINPARVSGLISINDSLFTNMVSFGSIESGFGRALVQNWVNPVALTVIYVGAIVCGLAIAILATSFCLTLGNNKMKRLGVIFVPIASIIGIAGATVLRVSYTMLQNSPSPGRLSPVVPVGIWVFYAMFALILVLSIVAFLETPKPVRGEVYEMEPKVRLFLLILPFLVLIFLFAYLPLWGWRISFFNFEPGHPITWDDFVGLHWIQTLFQSAATRTRILEVLRNTLAMSAIGLLTSWLPMAFAIFLSEMSSSKFRRTVQTLTTLPNFISWVLVFSVGFAFFATDGFLNSLLYSLNIIEFDGGRNWLMSGGDESVWLQMWLWGTWKGLGWGAIIYIASISSIDQELYEAAEVDGAGRFRRMWNITVPGLMNTFFVLLLLSISNILNSGVEQYLVFSNHVNHQFIEVIDLYVFNLGIDQGNIPLATLIGMLKSIISIILLFTANRVSKFLRGESIV